MTTMTDREIRLRQLIRDVRTELDEARDDGDAVMVEVCEMTLARLNAEHRLMMLVLGRQRWLAVCS